MARYFDAHNHLHDPRLAPYLPVILERYSEIGLVKCVVNGTRPEDWPAVEALARAHSQVIPSFGVHPWYIGKVDADWEERLRKHLDRYRHAIGEAGLDRWIENFDLPAQQKFFTRQLELASELNVAVSIHCLKAWGSLLEALKMHPLPRGFLLHSYGGPVEMIPEFVKLGARFSLSGYFAHGRKARQRETFRSVPRNRLLLETDAPDMLPPPELQEFKLPDSSLNHPANIRAVYTFASELLEIPLAELEDQIEENFTHLFL